MPTTALVTGAGPGSLGEATAAELRRLGLRVLTTTRSCPVSADTHPLDLTSTGSVAALADWVGTTTDRLDVLVNNAGIHLDLRGRWTTPQLVDGHEIHWRTNYLGTAQLTRLLLPLLLATAAAHGEARVVDVVSKLHDRGSNAAVLGDPPAYDSWAAYGTSKLALVHEAAELERRYGERGVHGYSLHPGSVHTRIADRGLETSPLLARLRKLAAPLERRALLSPEEGGPHHGLLRHLAGGGARRLPPALGRCRAVAGRPGRRGRRAALGRHHGLGRVGLDTCRARTRRPTRTSASPAVQPGS